MTASVLLNSNKIFAVVIHKTFWFVSELFLLYFSNKQFLFLNSVLIWEIYHNLFTANILKTNFEEATNFTLDVNDF